jgi:hypothetical protein
LLYSTKESTALERKSKETILDSGSISFAGYFLILDSVYTLEKSTFSNFYKADSNLVIKLSN